MSTFHFSEPFRFYNHRRAADYYTDARGGSPYHFLALMQAGHCRIVSSGKTIEANEGDLFYIPKGLPYQSYWCGEHIDFLSFGFSSFVLPDLPQPELQVIPTTEADRERVRAIPTVGREVDYRALSLFFAAMAELLPRMQYAPRGKLHDAVRLAQAEITRDPNRTLPEVARACSVSTPYLYAAFREVAHQTPNEFRQQVLCSRAAELLTTTDKTVEEISDLLGFSSASYFRKVLKHCLGVTPRRLRQSGGL